MSNNPFIRICNLHQRFGNQEVLRGVNLDIFRGETMVLLGKSGGGKSVLMKHLPLLLRPTHGEIFMDGIDITKLRERELAQVRHKVGMMFQNGALFDSLTLFENIAFPLREDRSLSEKTIRERVSEALANVSLADHGKKFPSEISGGMRKRVALARAVVDLPDCIIYDEPHAGLDPITAADIDELMKNLQRDKGITNLVITHEIRSAFRIADRIIFMHEGQIYWQGTAAALQATTDPLMRNFIEGNPSE